MNNSSPDHSHLKVIELRTWVHILKKKCKKMNKCFWQDIFVNYKPATFNYCVYNPVKKKFKLFTQSMWMKTIYLIALRLTSRSLLMRNGKNEMIMNLKIHSQISITPCLIKWKKILSVSLAQLWVYQHLH